MILCGFLSVQCFLPQTAWSAELDVVGTSVNSTFDAMLLRWYSNLDLERRLIHKTASCTEVVSYDMINWQTPLVTENGCMPSFILDSRFEDIPVLMMDATGFLEAEFVFTNDLITSDIVFSYLFEREMLLKMNPFPIPFRLPPLVQAPRQSDVPDPLSLFMLSIGILVLLGWSRRKRTK